MTGKPPFTWGNDGWRYWDRTSDPFRVRERIAVRGYPLMCVTPAKSWCSVSGEPLRTPANRSRLGTRRGTGHNLIPTGFGPDMIYATRRGFYASSKTIGCSNLSAVGMGPRRKAKRSSWAEMSRRCALVRLRKSM